MNNNIVTYTICIDTKNLKNINDVEEKIKKKLKKASSKLMKDILTKKEENILKRKKLVGIYIPNLDLSDTAAIKQ